MNTVSATAVQITMPSPTMELIGTVLPTPTPISSQTPTPEATNVPPPTATTIPGTILANYPIGSPGAMLGDGFFIRHGAEVENTWYNPGYWHTGEDWYALEGDTAGAGVYAIEDGEVVYVGGNYPGRVVIIKHLANIFSMYGHLDSEVLVREGQQVVRGTQLGTVLRRNDQVPSHLHFEVRTFLIKSEINGDMPRYGFRCGVNCPPGPGYWPISAPDLPDQVGWLNPTHVIAWRMLAFGSQGEVIATTQPISPELELWTELPGELGSTQDGVLSLRPGEKFQMLEMMYGATAPGATSALAYYLWYKIQLPDGRARWVQAAVPSSFETGSDGRPSSVRFNFVPVAVAGGG